MSDIQVVHVTERCRNIDISVRRRSAIPAIRSPINVLLEALRLLRCDINITVARRALASSHLRLITPGGVVLFWAREVCVSPWLCLGASVKIKHPMYLRL